MLSIFAGASRHNSVLSSLWKSAKRLCPASEIRADLPTRSYEACDSVPTIPPYILATAERPDIVIMHPRSRRILIIELRVPFDSNLEDRASFKKSKYSGNLMPQLMELCWEVSFAHVGIGALGTVPRTRRDSLMLIEDFKSVKPTCAKETHSAALTLSKIAIATSYTIFLECENAHWMPPGPLDLLTI